MEKQKKGETKLEPIKEKKNELEQALKREDKNDSLVKAIRTLLNKDKLN